MNRLAMVWTTFSLFLVVPLMVGGQEVETAQSGEELFLAYQCWQCHGYEGQGGPAPRIVPTAYPFEVFAVFVRYTNLMPAYSPNNLSNEQLKSIYDYVSSLPEPPSLEDIPVLRDL